MTYENSFGHCPESNGIIKKEGILQMKKVSIIMGVYNSENTIRQCIDSILSQTFENWELIMCDDCSTDNSYQIAEEYRSLYPTKIVLLKNEKNIRLAATLNRCLEYASGDYIARMDTDDICFAHRLEMQVLFFETNPNYHLVGSRVVVFNELKQLGVRGLYGDVTVDSFRRGSPFAHPSIMIKKDVLHELNGYRVSPETARCEDLDLWIRLYTNGYRGFNIQEPLLYYRENLSDLKKRKVRYGLDTTKVLFRGFLTLKVKKRYYINAFRPFISSILPDEMMYFYHNSFKGMINNA
ncbi:MAG: glycosyltransferase [Tannerellaceae bacterium]